MEITCLLVGTGSLSSGSSIVCISHPETSMNLNTLATCPPYVCCGVSLPAARQIRELAPQSKIIFVTQETSADIVKEVIGLGAMGYVVKTKVQFQLLKAIDSVLEGKQFIGSGLTGSP